MRKLIALAMLSALPALAADVPHIPANSKVYIAPMNGFEHDLQAAILKKKVQLVMVDSKDKADYEIDGQNDNEKAGWAKTILFNAQLKEQFTEFFHRDDTFSLGVCNGCQMMAQLRDIIPGASSWRLWGIRSDRIQSVASIFLRMPGTRGRRFSTSMNITARPTWTSTLPIPM